MTTPIPDATLDEWEQAMGEGNARGPEIARLLLPAYRESRAENERLMQRRARRKEYDPEVLLDRAETAEADLAALRLAVQSMSGDLWRVTQCGCGHRADLHTDAGCIAGLTFCGCRWTFTTVLQERLRSLLSTSTNQEEACACLHYRGQQIVTCSKHANRADEGAL